MEKFCQSCGMPLKNNKDICGTEKDGSSSMNYCAHCYQNGEFVQPQIASAQEMQAFVYQKMREKGLWPIVARFCTLMIPGLKRWKS